MHCPLREGAFRGAFLCERANRRTEFSWCADGGLKIKLSTFNFQFSILQKLYFSVIFNFSAALKFIEIKIFCAC